MHMSSNTKIVVIHMKELIIGAAIAVAVIILLIFTIVSLSGKSRSTGNTTGSKVSSAKTTSSTNIKNTYTPGVYTTSITLNGNPVDIQVTVDKDNINSIEMVNVSEAITTMYPMLQNSFQELADSVIQNGSTQNITYNSDNKYTSTMLLNAIQTTLDKATIQ